MRFQAPPRAHSGYEPYRHNHFLHSGPENHDGSEGPRATAPQDRGPECGAERLVGQLMGREPIALNIIEISER